MRQFIFICAFILTTLFFSAASAQKIEYDKILTPGARLVPGDLSKNEFFILAKGETLPAGAKMKRVAKVELTAKKPYKTHLVSKQQEMQTVKLAIKKAFNYRPLNKAPLSQVASKQRNKSLKNALLKAKNKPIGKMNAKPHHLAAKKVNSFKNKLAKKSMADKKMFAAKHEKMPLMNAKNKATKFVLTKQKVALNAKKTTVTKPKVTLAAARRLSSKHSVAVLNAKKKSLAKQKVVSFNVKRSIAVKSKVVAQKKSSLANKKVALAKVKPIKSSKLKIVSANKNAMVLAKRSTQTKSKKLALQTKHKKMLRA